MRTIAACLLAATATLAGPVANAADVGVSIGISQPGVYGRIDIGRFPQPAVIVPQPMLVVPQPTVVAAPPPVYMWVPPGHRKHWHKHCHEYGACGVPVYFVQERWYQQHVMAPQPVYSEGPGQGHGHGKGHGHGHGKGHKD